MREDNDYSAMATAAALAINYRAHIAVASRTPTADYATMIAALGGPTPEQGSDGHAIITDLVARAAPGIRASTAGRFFGWVIGQSHPTGVAADWLTAAWGQNAGNVVAAPAASAVEAVAAGWLLDLLGLPAQASVGFVTGATVANFVCLAAARNEVLRRTGWDVEADGLFGAPPVAVLIGADAHSTVYSALRYLGFGAKRVRTIATDAAGRMKASAFAEALSEQTGPTIAITQAGQINTGVSDPFAEIAPRARDHGTWLHVDGAFGLWARTCAEKAALLAGVEQADSWATDGHKWLQTPYDCGFAIVRNEAAHRRAMEIVASYLPGAGAGERDPSAYVPELSRRARGFATWAMIRQLGRSGIGDLVGRHCRIAAFMAAALSAEDGVTLVCPVELNQFMLCFGPEADIQSDDMTRAVIDQVQTDAIAFIGGASWRGMWVMRVSVTSAATDGAEAETTVAAVLDAFRRVRAR